MGYEAKILADTVSPAGDRITTFEISFPRFVLSEFNTHCAISRNSASSRAVPVARKLQEALDDPFIPSKFGRNQRGMSAAADLEGDEHQEAVQIWLRARDAAIENALALLVGTDIASKLPDSDAERAKFIEDLLADNSTPRRLDVHKQLVNRILEPFLWHTVIATATDWENFFALRTAESAQPEICTVALEMLDLRNSQSPKSANADDWHMPLIQEDEVGAAAEQPSKWSRISAARCARVSYLTHHGTRDIEADIELAERLLADGHMSPFEHVARCLSGKERRSSPRIGKLSGWEPLRSTIPDEEDYSKVIARRSSD